MQNKTVRGFTLIELMTTIAITTTVLGIGVPSYTSIVAKNQINTSRNTFIRHLQYARYTAITQRYRVTLCPTLDANQCEPDHTQWHKGYMVYIDKNKNRKRDDNEKVLRYQQANSTNIKIQSTSKYRRMINYRPDGTAWGSNTTIRFCGEATDKFNRKIALLGTGRPRYESEKEKKKTVICS